jgi:hypothetical protein
MSRRISAVPPPFARGSGDLLLRGSVSEGYTLLDPRTNQPIAQGLVSLADAVVVARRHGASQIRQERSDGRGQPIAHDLPRKPR